MMTSNEVLRTSSRTPHRMDLLQVHGLDLYAEYRSERTGGDFFDAIDLGSRVIFLLTDIAGTKAATQPIAADVQETFRSRGAEFLGSPETNVMDATAQLMQEINHALIRSAGGVRFAPTFVGCYDLALGILAYVNAGGMTAVFRDSEGARILGSSSVPLGLFSHLTYEPSMQAFEVEAKLLLVTKGVVDTPHGGAHFGVERLIPLLEHGSTGVATELCRAALKAADDFKQVPWYRKLGLRLGGRDADEDSTAMAVVRPA